MRAVLIGTVLAAGFAALAPGQASFTPIGDLPGGAFGSEALGMSPDGIRVVGYGTDAGGTRAIIWTSGTLTGLADPSGNYVPNHAYAVAANGVIAGDASGPSGQEAFKYNPAGGPQLFRALGGTSARGISSSGQIVVGRREMPDGSNVAARWDGPNFTALGFLDDTTPNSYALGISSNGAVVVGGADTPDGVRAFAIYNNEGFLTPLSDLAGSTQSEAHGCSSTGAVIVGNNLINGQFVAVRWVGGAAQMLPAVPGVVATTATACSGDGSVIVGHGLAGNQLRAVVWRGTQALPIKDVLVAAGAGGLGGWSLGTASGVSADGTKVCGGGAGPGGNEGWIARLPDLPPPCPADFNGDSFLDFFDADAFVACFEGVSCPPGRSADFNGDGFVDFFDADAFVEAFEAGC